MARVTCEQRALLFALFKSELRAASARPGPDRMTGSTGGAPPTLADAAPRPAGEGTPPGQPGHVGGRARARSDELRDQLSGR